MSARIGILIESWPNSNRVEESISALAELGVEFEFAIVSARHPISRIRDTVGGWEKAGVEVIVAFETGNALAALAKHQTRLPILSAGTESGSIIETAGQALRILSLKYPEYRELLEQQESLEKSWMDAETSRMQARLKESRKASGTVDSEANGRPRSWTAEERKAVEDFEKGFKPRIATEHRREPERKRQRPLDYSPALREVITASREIASAYGHGGVGPLHLLAAIIDTSACAARQMLERSGVDFEKLASHIREKFPPATEQSVGYFALEESASQLIQSAKKTARLAERPCLTTADLILSLNEGSPAEIAEALAHGGADLRKIDAGEFSEAINDECRRLLESRIAREPERPADWDSTSAQELQRRLFAHQAAPPGKQAGRQAEEEAAQQEEPPDAVGEGEEAGQSVAENSVDKEQQRPRIARCDPFNPPVEVVEDAADTILEGTMVIFPAENAYYAGVDATNAAAVERLFEIDPAKSRRPIQVFVHSEALVRSIVQDFPESAQIATEEFWPGPLTIVFSRHPRRFTGLAPDATIGIRVPDNYLALSMLSMVGRPVAAVSVSHDGEVSRSAAEAAEWTSGIAALVLDAGELIPGNEPTVLSVVEPQFRLIREGAVGKTSLQKVLGMELK